MSQNDLVLSHSAVMERYQPSAIVLQCGADSLSGDRLGCFNLTLHGHAKCVEFLKSFDLPLLLLGGGGYTLRNVARCWAYETAVAVDAQNQLSDHLPFHDYFDYYGPDYQLHITTNNMTDQNDRAYLEKIQIKVLENLRMMPCAPGVQMQAIPEDAIGHKNDGENDEDDDEKEDPDVRMSQRQRDTKLVCHEEFSDSEDEIMSDGLDQKSRRRRRNNQSYRVKKALLVNGKQVGMSEIMTMSRGMSEIMTMSSGMSEIMTMSKNLTEVDSGAEGDESTEEAGSDDTEVDFCR